MRMVLAEILHVVFEKGDSIRALVRFTGEETGLTLFQTGTLDTKVAARNDLLAFCGDRAQAFETVAVWSLAGGLAGCLAEGAGYSLEVELLRALVGDIGDVHPEGPVAFQLDRDGIAGGCRFGDREIKLLLPHDQGAVFVLWVRLIPKGHKSRTAVSGLRDRFK
jgi:hypothetical protein